jgi:hypothetical protein
LVKTFIIKKKRKSALRNLIRAINKYIVVKDVDKKHGYGGGCEQNRRNLRMRTSNEGHKNLFENFGRRMKAIHHKKYKIS